MSTAAAQPKRVGARSTRDVTPELKAALERGELESATLMELLVIEQDKLWAHCLPELAAHAAALKRSALDSFMDRVRKGGELLAKYASASTRKRALTHPSDAIRNYAAAALQYEGLNLPQLLKAARPLADDANAGVREIIWMAARPALAAELEKSVALLVPWTTEASPNLRRFATEATRPRGVWCAHIEALKTKPEMALALLEPLKADAHVYVQDSVSNWLNDASKTQPDWVRALTQRWLKGPASKATTRICTRALRSIKASA